MLNFYTRHETTARICTMLKWQLLHLEIIPKTQRKIYFRLITNVCKMHLGVYNDQLGDEHNARLRTLEICHMNFPSTLQHTVILGRVQNGLLFFCSASIHYLLMIPWKHFNWIVMACLDPLISLPFKTSIVQDSPSCATKTLTHGESS